MTCLSNQGILQGCGNQSTGGLRNVWITSKSNVDFDEMTVDADGVITAMPSGTSIATGTTFYKYESNRQVANLIETGSIDDTVGSVGFEPALTMRFSKQDKDKRNEILYFASTTVVAIIEDYNGQFRLVGHKEGLRPSVLNGQTGAALAEGNIYDVTLNGFESTTAPFIDSKSVFSDYIDVD